MQTFTDIELKADIRRVLNNYDRLSQGDIRMRCRLCKIDRFRRLLCEMVESGELVKDTEGYRLR